MEGQFLVAMEGVHGDSCSREGWISGRRCEWDG